MRLYPLIFVVASFVELAVGFDMPCDGAVFRHKSGEKYWMCTLTPIAKKVDLTQCAYLSLGNKDWSETYMGKSSWKFSRVSYNNVVDLSIQGHFWFESKCISVPYEDKDWLSLDEAELAEDDKFNKVCAEHKMHLRVARTGLTKLGKCIDQGCFFRLEYGLKYQGMKSALVMYYKSSFRAFRDSKPEDKILIRIP